MPIAEHCAQVDICLMIRKGWAAPSGWKSGALSWSCRGERVAAVSYSCDMTDPHNSWLKLSFRASNGASGGRTKQAQCIELSYTVPKYGGKKWWMHCPVDGSRIGKLYLPPRGDIFASRKAWRVRYRSQSATSDDRPFEALFRLQSRLGCIEGYEMPIRRPKGMHHRTFARLEQLYWQLDEQCGRGMDRMLEWR
jgi:hypothetical protein